MINYKHTVEICSLTGEECDRNVCDSCEVANEHKAESLTTFDRTATLFGLKLKTNRANTIAILNKDELKFVEEKGKAISSISSTVRKHPDDTWKTTHPSFAKFQKFLGLGEPKEIITDENKLGIVKYPDTIYLVAPLFKME